MEKAREEGANRDFFDVLHRKMLQRKNPSTRDTGTFFKFLGI